MSSYVELQSEPGADEPLRIALPDDIARDIACRLDGEWVTALHDALLSHRPHGGERFAQALDAGRDAATVLFEMPARAEGDPPVHVVRWTDAMPAATPRARPPKPPVV